MQNKLVSFFLISCFMFVFIGEIDAQSRKKRKKGKQRPPKTEQVDESEKSSATRKSTREVREVEKEEEKTGVFNAFSNENMFYEALGTLGFANRSVKLGLKPAAGYKFMDWWSVGVAAKVTYYYFDIELSSKDLHEFDLGAEVFTRFTILQSFYAQIAYDWNSFVFANAERTWINGPMIGGGYVSGFGNLQYGAQLMFELDEGLRNYDNSPLEIWIGLTYNL